MLVLARDGGMADSATSLCPALSPGTPRPPLQILCVSRKCSVLIDVSLSNPSSISLFEKVTIWSWVTGLFILWLSQGRCAGQRACASPSVLSLIRSAEFWPGRQHSLPIPHTSVNINCLDLTYYQFVKVKRNHWCYFPSLRALNFYFLDILDWNNLEDNITIETRRCLEFVCDLQSYLRPSQNPCFWELGLGKAI